MGDAKLKKYLTIDRRDEGSCYVIWCQRCETITYGVNGRGYMYYKEVRGLPVSIGAHNCYQIVI
jgi:hypothetical protein